MATKIAAIIITCYVGEAAVHVDACGIVAYYSMMSDEQTNLTDPLSVGDLISLQEAAEYAQLQKDSLHDYIKRGRLKAKKIGRFWVTTRAAVDAYLQSRNLENIPKKHRRSS